MDVAGRGGEEVVGNEIMNKLAARQSKEVERGGRIG